MSKTDRHNDATQVIKNKEKDRVNSKVGVRIDRYDQCM
jgi:hypothetical protein